MTSEALARTGTMIDVAVQNGHVDYETQLLESQYEFSMVESEVPEITAFEYPSEEQTDKIRADLAEGLTYVANADYATMVLNRHHEIPLLFHNLRQTEEVAQMDPAERAQRTQALLQSISGFARDPQISHGMISALLLSARGVGVESTAAILEHVAIGAYDDRDRRKDNMWLTNWWEQQEIAVPDYVYPFTTRNGRTTSPLQGLLTVENIAAMSGLTVDDLQYWSGRENAELMERLQHIKEM